MVFMVFGWFPWFFKVVSWFFMFFGWLKFEELIILHKVILYTPAYRTATDLCFTVGAPLAEPLAANSLLFDGKPLSSFAVQTVSIRTGSRTILNSI